MSVCWYNCMASPHAGTTCWLCTTQPAAPGCGWLAGPGCKPGAPPNHISSRAGAVLRSVGVFSVPDGVPILRHLWQQAKGEREGKGRSWTQQPCIPLLASPLAWTAVGSPMCQRPMLETCLVLSHAHNLQAQNTALWSLIL